MPLRGVTSVKGLIITHLGLVEYAGLLFVDMGVRGEGKTLGGCIEQIRLFCSCFLNCTTLTGQCALQALSANPYNKGSKTVFLICILLNVIILIQFKIVL